MTELRAAPEGEVDAAPRGAGLVLLTLILVATVANLNLAVANVALPEIGRAFDSSQTSLDLVAVGYSLGLASSVLWLGALGDRYGRRMMLVLGVALSIPACLLAAYAPSDEVLFAARLGGGIAAGMAFPTTLALITALWSGQSRTRAIALWSALGGAMAALGPLAAGALLRHYWWGSVFLITLPLAAVALLLAFLVIPSHINETTGPVDNLGGVLSAIGVGALVLTINLAPVSDARTVAIVLGLVTLATAVLFVVRQRRAPVPLYDLHIAARRTFWVAAAAGIIVFGALMGAMFIGQQYLQNVLGYNTLEAGLAILPAAVMMVVIAPRSAKLVAAKGSRSTLLTGYAFCLVGFVVMWLLWKDGVSYWRVALGYAFVGTGVGFAGTPASHSLTGSVPVTRAGMASGTADLQRDLGGALMQSILGALLTAGYAASVHSLVQGAPVQVTETTARTLANSFSSAENLASQPEYQQYADAIIAGAKESFIEGQDRAYLAGIAAIVLGAALVYFLFPRHRRETELLASYRAEDEGSGQHTDHHTVAGSDAL